MEYFGHTLSEAIHNAAHRKSAHMEKKARFQLLAPPLFWSRWMPIWSQFGVIGPNADSYKTVVTVSFNAETETPSTFEVEIKGGDELVRALGPGFAYVTITGNVATTLSIRCKSHSIAQNVIIDV